MCPGFDSRTRRHMWVEFVVGSRPCSESFSPGSPVFLPPEKPTFLNSNSIGNLRATGLSLEDCCVSPSLNKVDLSLAYLNALTTEVGSFPDRVHHGRLLVYESCKGICDTVVIISKGKVGDSVSAITGKVSIFNSCLLL